MANTAPSDTATYKRLLSAGRKIFARKCYSGTSVREIVAAAGVTKPVLYYYFRNKEELYLELFREPFAKLVALLNEVSNGRRSARITWTRGWLRGAYRLHHISDPFIHDVGLNTHSFILGFSSWERNKRHKLCSYHLLPRGS